MRVTSALQKQGEKVDHLFSQIPAIERSTVNKRESIAEAQLRSPSCAFFIAELERREIDATRNHFVMHCSTAQSFPFSDDGPYSLSQRDDGIRRSEDATLSGLRDAKGNAAFTPVFCVDVLLCHQPAHVEDHLRPQPLLQSERDGCGDMSARMDHLDSVAFDECTCFANTGEYVVDRSGHGRALVITQPVPFDAVSSEFLSERLTLRHAFGCERLRSFETQERESNAALRELAQVWNDLALAERIEHSVVRDEQNAPALKPHRRPPPEPFCSSENYPATAIECCR